MTNLNLDKYLNVANEEKVKHGLKDYAPLYPMLRVNNNKLYIGVMFTKPNDNVWDINEQIKPSYWILIDTKDLSIIEFNKTEEKDFVIGTLIPKDITNKQKEISKYTVEKTLQYEKYLIEDIKNDGLPIQKKLATILNDEIDVAADKILSIIKAERCRVDRIEDVFLNTEEEYMHEMLVDKDLDNNPLEIN